MIDLFIQWSELIEGPALGLETLVIFAAILAGLASVFLIASFLDQSTKRRANRLARVGGTNEVVLTAHGEPTIRRKTGETGALARLARFVPGPQALQARLSRTGRNLGPGKYALITLICGTLSAGLVHVWGGVPFTVTVLSGLALGLLLPHLWVGSMISRRETAFLKNLPEGIDVMVRGLKAGLPVTESLGAAGREAPEPVGGIFRAASDMVRMGKPIEDAISKTAERMAVPELRFLAITLSVQKETGGNLTETLANLSDILRRRRQMKLKVRAVSSEARASAMILGSLPFVMFAILLLVNRGYVMQLFEDPRGHVMVGIGLGSILAGVFVMSRMIRFDI